MHIQVVIPRFIVELGRYGHTNLQVVVDLQSVTGQVDRERELIAIHGIGEADTADVGAGECAAGKGQYRRVDGQRTASRRGVRSLCSTGPKRQNAGHQAA